MPVGTRPSSCSRTIRGRRRTWRRREDSEEETNGEIALRARLEEVVLPEARIVGVGAVRRGVDQGVVVVAVTQVDGAPVDRRRLPRRAGASVEEVELVPRRLLVEGVQQVQLEAQTLVAVSQLQLVR